MPPGKRKRGGGAASSSAPPKRKKVPDTTESSIQQVTVRVRKTGMDKAYPRKIKASMEDKRILLANRRGITNNFIEQEKPSFTPEELYENRKRGLSFSSIGKKLGIDNTKEEVLNVYKVMQECDGSLPDIETMETHALKSYPTPLWFLFNSELDIIAKDAIPDDSNISTGVPRRISERLGERAVELLGAYMLVNTVVKEEVAVGLASADDGTPLGKMNTWTNGLPLKLLTKSSDLFGGIVKSALCHTTHFKEFVGEVRCQCGSVKYLKCAWTSSSLPSFFWGCVQYRATERFYHDRARAFRSANVKLILESPSYYSRMVHKDIVNLAKMLDEEKNKHMGQVDMERIAKIFGPDIAREQVANVTEFLQTWVDLAHSIAKERQDSNLASLAKVNEGIPGPSDSSAEL